MNKPIRTHVSVGVGAKLAEVLPQHPPHVSPYDTAAAVHVEVGHLHKLLEAEDSRLRHVPQDILRPGDRYCLISLLMLLLCWWCCCSCHVERECAMVCVSRSCGSWEYATDAFVLSRRDDNKTAFASMNVTAVLPFTARCNISAHLSVGTLPVHAFFLLVSRFFFIR